MIAYKGFNKNMTCRGFQYEEGKEYETDTAKLCESGFHACENPLDCFKYYVPGQSVYHKVELEDNGERNDDDTKVVGKKIKIGAKLSVGDICKLHFDFVKEHTTSEFTNEKKATAGNYGAATAGYRGAATAGENGAATAGNYGAATAGNYGAATAGNYGAATAGNYGAATAGENGAATAGYRGAATAGNYGAATSRGKSSVGNNGLCVARGNGCMVKSGIGSIILIAEENSNDYLVSQWNAAIVDGEIIKADTWYKLENGEFVEVEDDE